MNLPPTGGGSSFAGVTTTVRSSSTGQSLSSRRVIERLRDVVLAEDGRPVARELRVAARLGEPDEARERQGRDLDDGVLLESRARGLGDLRADEAVRRLPARAASESWSSAFSSNASFKSCVQLSVW